MADPKKHYLNLAVQAPGLARLSIAHVSSRLMIRSWSVNDQLSQTIDDQMTRWNLTNSEKEVAFLLLKGLSSKEIAEIRKTTEKTARTQSMAIYSKAGLAGRSELAAFFLEDLLPPSSEHSPHSNSM